MNVKKIVPAAAVTPAAPCGAKSAKLSAWNAVTAIAANMRSTPSLMITMTVFTAADSRVPRMSRSAHRPTRTTAGRFTTPPSSGPADSAAGMSQPNRSPTRRSR